jgi:hypothetical protein
MTIDRGIGIIAGGRSPVADPVPHVPDDLATTLAGEKDD